MTWFRKGNAVAAAAVLALVSLFLWLCLDPILAWSLRKAGERAAGAKVDIGAVRTRIFAGRLELRDVAVADRNAPMKNLFAFERAAFRFSPSAALRAKADISDAELTGLRFGTTRAKSGALPFAPPSAFDAMIRRQLEPAARQLTAKAAAAAALPKDVDPAKLSSLKSLDSAQNALRGVQAKWKDKAGVEKIDARLKDLQAQVKTLQTGGNSPAEILRKARTAQQLRGEISDLARQVDDSRKAVSQDLGGVTAALKNAEELKGKDLDALLSAAGLPALDAESLTRRLLGPRAAARTATAVHWIAWARRRAAAGASPKTAQPARRRRGVDVEFPNRRRRLPAFLLENAQLSGSLAGLFQGRDLDLEGTLTGVTSNPPLYGKPARLSLKGTTPGGPAMDLTGTLDQTHPPGGVELSFHYTGLPLAGTSLGDPGLGADVTAGAARVSGTIRVTGEDWKGEVLVQADGLALTPKLELPADQAKYAALALKSVRRLTAVIGVSGRENDLKFSLSSDLGQALAEGFQRAVAGQFAAQRKALQAKIDALCARKADPLRRQLATTQAGLLGPLDAQSAALRQALRQVVGPKAQGLDQLKLFR